MGDLSDCFIRLLLKPLLVVVLQTSVVIFLGQAPVDIINHEAKYRNPTYSNPRYSHPQLVLMSCQSTLIDGKFIL